MIPWDGRLAYRFAWPPPLLPPTLRAHQGQQIAGSLLVIPSRLLLPARGDLLATTAKPYRMGRRCLLRIITAFSLPCHAAPRIATPSRAKPSPCLAGTNRAQANSTAPCIAISLPSPDSPGLAQPRHLLDLPSHALPRHARPSACLAWPGRVLHGLAWAGTAFYLIAATSSLLILLAPFRAATLSASSLTFCSWSMRWMSFRSSARTVLHRCRKLRLIPSSCLAALRT